MKSALRLGIFLLVAGMILAAGLALRTYQFDRPPVDFPGDRNGLNYKLMKITEIGERSPFSPTKDWTEVWLISWLPVKTRWLAGIFHWEMWTLARAWAIFFGVATVLLTGCAGYFGARIQRLAPARRRRLALLCMAGVAFNPYHIALSRMILTEPVTIAFQAGAAAFLLAAICNGGKFRWLIPFLFCFTFAGLTKIPALFWTPAIAICWLFSPGVKSLNRWVGIVGIAVAIALVFQHYSVTPFNILAGYSKQQPWHTGEAAQWMFTPLWNRAYAGRIILLLTLPGTLLALIGLVYAPWFIRIAVLTYLVSFYGLNMQNTYNSAHIIVPGMILAAWGADRLIESATREKLRLWGCWRLVPQSWGGFLERAFGGVLVTALFVLLYPLGPQVQDTLGSARPDLIQAREVINKLVPANRRVYTNEPETILAPFMDHPSGMMKSPMLVIADFYSVTRSGPEVLNNASAGWVHWASLPTEPPGFLVNDIPVLGLPAGEAGQYADLTLSAAPAAASGLGITRLRVPTALFKPALGALVFQPGSSFKIEITWTNKNQLALADARLVHRATRTNVPLPIREGGLAYEQGGVLCLPKNSGLGSMVYTFEPPAGFPAGEYVLGFFPLVPGGMSPDTKPEFLPVKLICQAAPVPTREVSANSLYPARQQPIVSLWSEDWFYKNTRLDGYRFLPPAPYSFFYSYAGGKAGKYRLTVRGAGRPVISKASPAPLWPRVEALLPGDANRVLGAVAVASEKTGRFSAEFDVPQDFDFLILRPGLRNGAMTPLMPPNFAQADYGANALDFRGALLEKLK